MATAAVLRGESDDRPCAVGRCKVLNSSAPICNPSHARDGANRAMSLESLNGPELTRIEQRFLKPRSGS
jgi:hypothetical protein